jgi:isoleucyl-tRNA synthetase
MTIMKKLGGLLAPNDPLLVEKTLVRINEQDKWNDVFSTKLIELLDSIDELKAEVRERLRQTQAVLRAESTLLDEASKINELRAKYENARAALDEARAENISAKQAQLAAAQELERAFSKHDAASSAYRGAHQFATEASVSMKRAEQLYKYASKAAVIASSIGLQTIQWTCWVVLHSVFPVWLPLTLSVGLIAGTVYGIRRIG